MMMQLVYDACQCREPCRAERKACHGTHRCARRGVGATRRPCKLEPKQAGARMALAAGLATGAGVWNIATGIVSPQVLGGDVSLQVLAALSQDARAE